MTSSILTPQNFEIYSGDNKTVKFTITDQNDAIKDITAATAKWAVARSRRAAINFTKETGGSGITITDGPAGLLQIEIDAADTDDLVGDFYHELEITDAAGRKSTAAQGTMRVREDLIQ